MRKKRWIVFIVVLLTGMTIAATGYYYFVERPNIVVADDGIILIQPGDSFETVVRILLSQGYLQDEYTFRKVAELKKYPAGVKSGRYRIHDKMNNSQLVNLLRSGRQEPVHFTFNNIRTMPDFAGMLFRQLAIDSAEFMQLARDPEYLKKWKFTPENFIGMFIPNTYQIFWHPRTEDFMKRMNTEYLKFWTADRRTKAQKAGLSPMDVIIIASIVEEETNQRDEYPIIAGVYVNRLKKGWKLEACPTLKYALGNFTLKRILTKHMETESPYNT
ncbi:MAG: endolytic transglycosylase MltG, partial [Odoribacter sp.]|nr:endolytic transglycosylase MltG [Odoribacter sp.]